MILLYLFCGFLLVSCILLAVYANAVAHQRNDGYSSVTTPTSPVYEINACRVLDPNTQQAGLLVPKDEWTGSQSSLLINGSIYTVKSLESKADYYQLHLDPEFTFVFGDGLQGMEMDKWFKLHLLQK
jgi:hypothetical protein